MFDHERVSSVNPTATRDDQLANIRQIYPPEREALGVVAIGIELVDPPRPARHHVLRRTERGSAGSPPAGPIMSRCGHSGGNSRSTSSARRWMTALRSRPSASASQSMSRRDGTLPALVEPVGQQVPHHHAALLQRQLGVPHLDKLLQRAGAALSELRRPGRRGAAGCSCRVSPRRTGRHESRTRA